MEHPIFFPEESKLAIANRINKRLREVKFSRYGNEPNYTPALVERLQNFRYNDENITVKIAGAVMTGIAPNNAENELGADFSIVATITKNGETLRKGIVFQAKRGTVESLRSTNSTEYNRFEGQIHKMKKLCPNPKVLEIYDMDGSIPTVVSGTSVLSGGGLQHLTFGDWMSKRFIPTFDGYKDPSFVDELLDARLSGLRLVADIKR